MRREIGLMASVGLLLFMPGPSVARSEDDSLVRVVSFRPGYFSPRDQREITEPSLPRSVMLQLPLIAGSTVGAFTSPPVVSEAVSVGKLVAVDLERLRVDVERVAVPITPEASRAGLRVTPQETKFARVATLVFHPKTRENLGLAGLWEPSAGWRLTLVYFDRPCKLTGILRTAGEAETHYDVHMTKPGFHLLKTEHQPSSIDRVTGTSAASRVQFRIWPFAYMDT
jgi:hypothetical protein